jgi:2-methylisocitrate lyase-like PEP mutase family enzyme
MTSHNERAAAFHALHKAGAPLILFNVWDAGSAKVAAQTGAKAIATGSASVGGALGFGDGEAVPIDLVLANAERIVGAVALPVALDFEGGYAVDAAALADNFTRALASGIVGCNFEDQIIGGAGLHPIDVQFARIAALRTAAERVGVNAFINARTDIFLKTPSSEHDTALVDVAIERGRAYADAGANGLFLPGLADDALVEKTCAASPLPVNIMVMPHVSPVARLTELGVARISYGPGPWRLAMKAFEDAAKAVMV